MAGAEIIGKEELDEILELFSRDQVTLYRYGQNNYKTRELEENFARYMGVKYAHAVSSGTAAIHCALAAVGIGPGDEVITTAWTFVAPIEAINALGASPVLVNLDSSFHLDPVELESKITNKTKAIVSVPMWAAPDLDAITAICKEHSILLIEDAAQSLGASYKGKKLGTFGALGTFSFDAGKSLHVGEGGMVITDDQGLYEKVAEFSDHGHMHVEGIPRGKDPRRMPGLNYRMSELTAAVGLAQLKKIDFILDQATQNKYSLKNKIIDIPELKMRDFHDEEGAQGDTLIFSLSNHKQALALERALADKGYGTKILPEAIDWHYGGSWVHIFPHKTTEELEKSFQETGDLLRRSICLNISLNMTAQSISEIAQIIQDFCNTI
ncbi:DegT/DnrJ/EryC1/StrS family aminotransferase [Gammaproteobacteria bacterium]|nr:DegT/DnrJ/EryC1/StrS family aminotransferase [Gammaproteobacteria bacterium]MDB9859539.1 DegT/DnrJ/EryC1/StrS family aminotransferase [Gammaproteobacteria bacterium]MDB9940062.1 DegT/DnrJ/EryC1/StrS family aminotransferase [Gammaproteobacteria bacterium]